MRERSTRNEAAGAEPMRYTLPTGRRVACPTVKEAAVVWQELSAGAYDDAASELGPGDTVIDVGAHIGLTSLHFADRIDDLRILACEPAPRLFPCLRENFERHLPGATPIATAIGAVAGTAELTYYPAYSTMSTLYVDDADDQHNFETMLANMGASGEMWSRHWRRQRRKAERVEVPVRTLTEVFTEHRVRTVGLLKVDVERSEFDVLLGIDEANWPLIRTIVAEVHDVDGALERTVTLLETRGYHVAVTQQAVASGCSVHTVIARR